MIIKTGDLREDSHADDDPSKKAVFVEKDGFGVYSDKVAEVKLVKVSECLKEDNDARS